MDYGTTPLLNDETSVLAAIIVFFLLLAFFVNVCIPFKRERDYIKMEMARSFEEKEYLYWKRELKRLYFSYIPLISKFFRQ